MSREFLCKIVYFTIDFVYNIKGEKNASTKENN